MWIFKVGPRWKGCVPKERSKYDEVARATSDAFLHTSGLSQTQCHRSTVRAGGRAESQPPQAVQVGTCLLTMDLHVRARNQDHLSRQPARLMGPVHNVSDLVYGHPTHAIKLEHSGARAALFAHEDG